MVKLLLLAVISFGKWIYAFQRVFIPLKRQEKNASENVVCWSRLLQIIA